MSAMDKRRTGTSFEALSKTEGESQPDVGECRVSHRKQTLRSPLCEGPQRVQEPPFGDSLTHVNVRLLSLKSRSLHFRCRQGRQVVAFRAASIHLCAYTSSLYAASSFADLSIGSAKASTRRIRVLLIKSRVTSGRE